MVSSRRSRAVLLVVAVTVVTVVIAGAGVQMARSRSMPTRPELEAVATIEWWGQGLVQVDDELWLTSSANIDGDLHMILVKLDADSGRQLDRIDLGPGAVRSGMALHDGDLILRSVGSDPGVEPVELPWFTWGDEAAQDSVLRVDADTMTVSDQWMLPSSFERFWLEQPIVITGDRYQVFGESAVGFIDLETGESNLSTTSALRNRTGMRVDGDIIEVLGARITRIDTRTGKWEDIEVDPLPGADPFFPRAFKYHDERYWIDGYHLGVDAKAFPVDLETGTLGPAVPEDDLPNRSIDAVGYRWDFYYPGRWLGPRVEPDEPPPSTPFWRQVDPTTGEAIADFDFEGFVPVRDAGDHLWLTRSAGSVTEIARMVVEPPADSGP